MSNFKVYLQGKSQSEAFNLDNEYFAGSADCFLTMAAKALVSDGLDRETVATFLITAALDVLQTDKTIAGQRAADDAFMRLALGFLGMAAEFEASKKN